jgi:hypothetical protein
VNLRARLLIALTVMAALCVSAASFAGDDASASELPVAGAVTVGGIDTATAQVAAILQLGKGSAAYWFEYWVSPGAERQTPAATATHEEDDKEHRVAVSRTLTGLLPGTRYSVRLVATSSTGTSTGEPTTFTTAAAPAAAPDPSSPAPSREPGAPAAQPPSGPTLGATFVAAAEQGNVRVRLPGSDGFVDLPQAASVPVGSVVDGRAGAIALTTALPGGGVQTARFGGARFQVRQAADGDGRVRLHLRGGRFGRCGARSVAAVAAGKKPRAVRRLWGKDHSGRFRTHGRDSVTTVRGTAWSVADRCDGTVTRVTEGAVDVRVRRTGRIVRLTAGERFLARHRG